MGARFLGLPAWAILFMLAFAIRSLQLAAWVSNHPDFYRIGGEIGRVALTVVREGRFADPYMIPTGPTAHPTPLSVAPLALIYGLFGVTPLAGFVRAGIGICSYSLLCALMPWFACRLGLGIRAGIIAGSIAALIPMQGLGEAIGVGTVAQCSLAFALLTVAFLRRWRAADVSPAGSLLLGVACGAAFHLLPPLLVVVLGFLIFELWWKRGPHRWIAPICVVLGAVLACIPWAWRNARELHGFVFIRSNFGLELRIANHPGSEADIMRTLSRQGTLRHPSENMDEALKVRELGEAEYNRRARTEAIDWIRSRPREFVRLSFLRFLHFWCGPPREPLLALLSTAWSALGLVGLWRVLPRLDRPGQASLLIPLAAFPLVYYVVSYVEHYPAPLTWLLLLLAGYCAEEWLGRGQAGFRVGGESVPSGHGATGDFR